MQGTLYEKVTASLEFVPLAGAESVTLVVEMLAIVVPDGISVPATVIPTTSIAVVVEGNPLSNVEPDVTAPVTVPVAGIVEHVARQTLPLLKVRANGAVPKFA
jgi:hypothetical protein